MVKTWTKKVHMRADVLWIIPGHLTHSKQIIVLCCNLVNDVGLFENLFRINFCVVKKFCFEDEFILAILNWKNI